MIRAYKISAIVVIILKIKNIVYNCNKNFHNIECNHSFWVNHRGQDLTTLTTLRMIIHFHNTEFNESAGWVTMT